MKKERKIKQRRKDNERLSFKIKIDFFPNTIS